MLDFSDIENNLVDLFKNEYISSKDILFNKIKNKEMLESYIAMLKEKNSFKVDKENRPTLDEIFFEAINGLKEREKMENIAKTKNTLDSYFDSEFFKDKKVADNIIVKQEIKLSTKSESSRSIDNYFKNQG